MCASRRHYAFAAKLEYAGAKTSVTNDSSVVGVVFFAERCSSGTTSPAFAPFHISITSAAVFFGRPAAAYAPMSFVAIHGIGASLVKPPGRIPIVRIGGILINRFSMK